MNRLKGAHSGERAVVIFGGPSLIAQGFDFASLRDRGFVTFLEAKALTPHLRSTLAPDYYLMLFPEKSKDNGLQQFIFRSFLADFRIDRWLKPECARVATHLRAHFHDYFETWRPQRGPHKRFRWRSDGYLQDSPYDLLRHIPRTRILANRSLIDEHFPHFAYSDRTFYFGQLPGEKQFELGNYFTPVERDGQVLLRCGDTFLNSAAIALYPLLRFMGFRETFFLGMDMSMLGSLEYAAPYTFKSMLHFRWFFYRTRHVFNANFLANRRFFQRPQSEFEDLRRVWDNPYTRFTRVFDPWKYATPVEGIRTMSVADFLKS
ncbi:MAG: hypothetical protein CL471_04250 [Acidobacteria bacterium]|nr:hypothetical protein [Acidobacteriota bacterium]